jgi:NAD(P)-dependent dehydrogenase (short-subunit alcohol dehydrogenase family)
MAGKWTFEAMPDQAGRTALITGANSGLGYEAALAFARRGARVIMACRDATKGETAAAAIRAGLPDAQLVVLPLDLADLASVRAFAAEVSQAGTPLDLLINNAGIMAIPYRQTADGFEMQFGTNHLGHFALTGMLLPGVLAAAAGRIVTVSSLVHRRGRMRFDDLHGTQRYDRTGAYAQSKLANLLFAFELQRRLGASGARAISVACHPGYSATNLQFVGPQMDGSRMMAGLMGLANTLVAQSAAQGVLPTLYAATAPDVNGCDYIGPDGLMAARGYPRKEQALAAAYSTEDAARLWAESEAMTGVRYVFNAASEVAQPA